MTPPILMIGIGNPSRGDDALGPLCIARLATLHLPDVELITDFQLQVEYALDLADRQEVIFIDAALSGEEPYSLTPVPTDETPAHTTHAISPGAVLSICRRVGVAPPDSVLLLAIRGYQFELGEGLSLQAEQNLQSALGLLHSRYCPTISNQKTVTHCG